MAGCAAGVIRQALALRWRSSHVCGVAFYLGHLSHSVFKDSMLFPVVLTVIGLAVIAAGFYWQRHETAIGAWLRSCLPAQVRDLMEHRASH